MAVLRLKRNGDCQSILKAGPLVTGLSCAGSAEASKRFDLEDRSLVSESSANLSQLNDVLNSLGVVLMQIPLHQAALSPSSLSPQQGALLEKLLLNESLTLLQKQTILHLVRDHSSVNSLLGARTRSELLALNVSSAHLYKLLAEGSRPKYHVEDEFLYILSGECIFGFSHPDLGSIELLIQPQDCLKVPAGLRHWYSLSAMLQLKAIRYLSPVMANNSRLVQCHG